MSTEPPTDVKVYTSSGIYASDQSFKLSAVKKSHSPSHNHKQIAKQLYNASVKGHDFINEHHCITKRCSNPGCGAFLRTAGQHICAHAHKLYPPHSPTASPRAKSRGGRRTLRNKRTHRNKRTLRIRR